ncbi:protein bcn92-like isoform X2 [Varroa jacobsoni]|uniref:Complex 1 LYR protein domain-containing protein n=1 Tax=Varroa destructor TaxID=109461 RepID=A0A7M7JNC6_VARDE|nr:protein bcn92-like isoform X2 [Varroa destructor]XP_022695514.1 protein bcn92-like isoform X2 [Varroa jacobsoni]
MEISVSAPKMSARAKVLTLYRQLLRESAKWPNYSYRSYAQRKIRDSFRANRSLAPGPQLEQAVQQAQESLAIVQRQVIIGLLYKDNPVIIDPRATCESSR